MIEQEIQRKIEDFRELGLPHYVPRDGDVHLVKNTVSTVIGARRAGKSYRVLQVADEMIKTGAIQSIRHVCALDFDNPILSAMKGSDVRLIATTFLKITPECNLNTPILFIFDEIHKIPGWEEAVIDLSRNTNWRVIVTGSSSKLMRDDISTELRGKALSSTVYPLSFGEFLRFKGFQDSVTSTKGQAEVARYFDEYLKWGGYPAMPELEEFSREALLREYFDTMILKDIIQRFNVNKPRLCIQMYNYLLSNISKAATLQSVYDYLKNSGLSTSRDAIRDYIHWAGDAWFLFMVPIFSDSHKEQERNYKKVYAIDWALAMQNSLVWDGSYSRAFENMIFLHLIRKFSRVRYYLTKTKRQEVDFVVLDNKGKTVLAAQVCLDISRSDTLERELEPLIATAKYFKIKENIIVTVNQERSLKKDGVSIKVVPAWKWLLG
jgi:predicted AAA+ superfamily ATPase